MNLRITLAALAVATIALSAPAEARTHRTAQFEPMFSAAAAPVYPTGRQARTHHARHRAVSRRVMHTTSTYRADDEDSRYERPRHRVGRHHARRSGSCDGFQRCRCGTTAARHFGLPYAYKGFNLKMASEWARAFPKTSFGIGVAGVKPHHVLAVVGGSDCHSATVYDDAGTRQRNVCGMIFVAVNGNVGSGASFEHTSDLTRTYHAKSLHHRRVRYAYR